MLDLTGVARRGREEERIKSNVLYFIIYLINVSTPYIHISETWQAFNIVSVETIYFLFYTCSFPKLHPYDKASPNMYF